MAFGPPRPALGVHCLLPQCRPTGSLDETAPFSPIAITRSVDVELRSRAARHAHAPARALDELTRMWRAAGRSASARSSPALVFGRASGLGRGRLYPIASRLSAVA